jgi:hypothetical protein
MLGFVPPIFAIAKIGHARQRRATRGRDYLVDQNNQKTIHGYDDPSSLRNDGKHDIRSVGAVLENLVPHNDTHAHVGNTGTWWQSPVKAARTCAKVGRDQMKGLAPIG